MKNLKVLVCLFAVGSVLIGCSSSESDLTPDDRVKMDKLFREGVKPPSQGGGSPASPGTPAPRGEGGTPINAADQ